MKCYLCASQMQPFLLKNGYMIYVCTVCGLKQTDLRKNYDSFVKDHYVDGYFTGDPLQAAYVDYKGDKEYIIKNFSQFIQKLKYYKRDGKLLDVGCAMGYFVEMAQKHGYDAYGFDPSRYATKEAEQIVPKKISQGTIQDVTYPKNSFDIITLLDVFEHLQDPITDLQKIHKWLKKDGLILIATGDTNSLLPMIIGRRWTFYNTPQHLFFFNKKTMTKVLEKANFEPVEWFRIGKWLSLRYVLHLARTSGESKVAQILYHVFGSNIVGQLPLYLPVRDNMIVVARRK